MAGAAVLTVLLGIGYAAFWPFTRSRIASEFADTVQGTVEIRKFRPTYFPHPGCVAEGVTIRNYGGLPNVAPITIQKLRIRGTLRSLFSGHLYVHAEGMRMTAAGPKSFAGWKASQSKSRAVVDELIVSDSTLEITRGADRPALRFDVRQLVLQHPKVHTAMPFSLALRNPEPPGFLRVNGSLGPWNATDIAQTPISGTYSFNRADLGAFHGIAGILSSHGTVDGRLAEMKVRGTTSTPDFEVKETGHKLPLAADFEARVNSSTGDVVLERVWARLGRSNVAAEGSVRGKPGEPGKTANVALSVRSGKIQDFLFLFLKDEIAPMTGTFSFKGQAVLPPGSEEFDKRVELEGDFGISGASLVNPETQAELEKLSERAEGEKNDTPETVVSDLKGHVVLRGGTATFSHLSFRVPGAVAHLHGTYSITTMRMNFQGRLLTEATLEKTTYGVESFLLKIIGPFLKKNHRGGGVLTLSVTGTYPRPVYRTFPVQRGG